MSNQISSLAGQQCLDNQVAIVITNWNGRSHLEPLLRSILGQSYQDFEIYIVDNASTDGSVEMLRQCFPQVRIIQNETNLGLCAANNRAILTTAAEFVLILNNDTELEPDCLEQLVQAIKMEPTIGMCATKMLLTDQRHMVESAGIVVDRAGIAWGLESGGRDSITAKMPAPVFGACGGAALYRRSMLLEIGLFDEDFFVYFEDADVAWRGQWAGWGCVYVPGAVAYHAHSATIKEGSPFKTRLLGRNKIWLIAKNYPWPQLLWYSPVILLYELMSLGYNFLSGRGFIALKARFEALRRLPEMLAKRRRLVRRISSTTMINKLHPVESPLTLLRRHRSLARTVSNQYQ
jgi:hypothetical protein